MIASSLKIMLWDKEIGRLSWDARVQSSDIKPQTALGITAKGCLRFRLAGGIFTVKAPAYVCLLYSALLYAIIARSVLVGIAHNA